MRRIKIYITFALAKAKELCTTIFWNGALVQLVRIHACHAWGHGFESRTHRKKLWEIFLGVFLFFPNQAIDLNTLSDDDFDTHIDTLTPTEAIEAISQRRGVEDADQYAHWRKAVLNKQRDAAQRKLNAKHKPFDPSRYNSYPEMKRAEALYNQQISQQHDEARATIDALDKQIADINQYQNRRNAQIAAEREAYNDYDTPATSTTPRKRERVTWKLLFVWESLMICTWATGSQDSWLQVPLNREESGQRGGWGD